MCNSFRQQKEAVTPPHHLPYLHGDLHGKPSGGEGDIRLKKSFLCAITGLGAKLFPVVHY